MSQGLTLAHALPVTELHAPAAPEDDFEEQGLKEWLTRRTSDVDLERVVTRLEALQSQIDGLLAGVARTAAGMRLATVEVSLAITVEGNIGIASAGTQASLTLSYVLPAEVSVASDQPAT